MHKRILIAMTSHDRKGDTGQPTGAYLPEVAHPYEVFTKAGYEVELASVRGGPVPLDGTDDPDAVSTAFLRDAGDRLRTSLAAAAVDPARYDAIFFAGGHGAMWDLPASPAVQSVTRKIFEMGGIVAAVCHGPAALVNVKLSDGSYLVSGRNLSAFTDSEERAVGLDKTVPFLLASTLIERGAAHHPAPDWNAKVVVDGRLITGQNPQSATGVGEAIRDLLVA